MNETQEQIATALRKLAELRIVDVAWALARIENADQKIIAAVLEKLVSAARTDHIERLRRMRSPAGAGEHDPYGG